MIFLARIIITIVLLGITVLISDNTANSALVSLLLCSVSALNLYNSRNNKFLFILFSIIFYINISATFPGFIYKGRYLARYQFDLWNSQYATIYAKCLLIVNVVFYYFFSDPKLKQCEIFDQQLLSEEMKSRENLVIPVICYMILIFIFVYCFNGSSVLTSGHYDSNDNALYEYSIFFFAIAWFYGSSYKYTQNVWVLLAIYYILIGVLSGDRSSCFMLVVLIALYYWERVSLFKMFLFAFAGIVSANAIAYFRNIVIEGNINQISSSIMSFAINSFFSDTAYYSCYSGLTITCYSDIYDGSKLTLFVQWIIRLFTGRIIVNNPDVELVSAARTFNTNGGGGMFPAYFYFYGGYLGVFIATIVTASILKNLYSNMSNMKNGYMLLLKFIIPAMSLRWYLYSPTTFFRSCLINFGLIYIFFYVIDKNIKVKSR